MDYIIAVQFAGEGLVVDLVNMKSATPLFDCTFWSAHTNERERLFIGSLQPFTFQTIHDLAPFPPLHYSIWIRAIGILMMMISGYPYEISAIKRKDFVHLSALVFDKMNGTHKDSVPLYNHNLFAYVAQNVKKIQENLFLMDLDEEHAEYNHFGYKRLKPLFFVNGHVNFCKFCQIFDQKLEQIVVSNIPRYSFNKSIHLNSSFLDQIFYAIERINNSVDLRSSFKAFIIVNPYGSIDDFIYENQAMFAANGWKLQKTLYIDEKRKDAKSDNVLSIQPLN